MASLHLHLLPAISGEHFFPVFSFSSSVLSFPSSLLVITGLSDLVLLAVGEARFMRDADQSVMPSEVPLLCPGGFLFLKGFAKGILHCL